MKRSFAILIVVAMALSACSWLRGKHEDKFVKCPQAEMLAQGQGWIVPPGDDWKARAQISEYSTSCKITKDKALFTVTPKIRAERSGDVKDGMKQGLPLYLVVMHGDEILQKKAFTETIKFKSGDKIAENTFDLPVELPLGDAGTVADRTVVLAFQLNEDQLKYFRDLRDAQAKAAMQPAAAPVKSAPAVHGPATK